MSSLTYCLLTGRVQQAKLFSQNPNQRPHYHLLIQAGQKEFDVAINIASEDPNTQDVRVLYAVKSGITPPNASALQTQPQGIQNLEGGDPLRLDYVADGLVSRNEMSLLPLYDRGNPDGVPIPHDIDSLIRAAVGNSSAAIYVFGHRYGFSRRPDPAWHFQPDDGVHNIHMNQGNAPGNHDDENGRHEDGALLIHLGDGTWSGFYVAFQTQSWNNDDSGYPLSPEAASPSA